MSEQMSLHESTAHWNGYKRAIDDITNELDKKRPGHPTKYSEVYLLIDEMRKDSNRAINNINDQIDETFMRHVEQ